jgi:hypothetical protein
MTQSTGPDRQRVAALMAELNKLQASKADPDRRDQVLDELQDLVGLAGKMVMENDIVRKAKKILGEA